MNNWLLGITIINNDSINPVRRTLRTQRKSLLTACVLLFLVDSNKFFGRFFTVSITVSNQLSVLLECLPIFVSHQKHTPLTCEITRSLRPKRWANIITPINSIRFSLTAHKIRAAAVPAWAVSITAVCSINITYPALGNTCIPYVFQVPNQ